MSIRQTLGRRRNRWALLIGLALLFMLLPGASVWAVFTFTDVPANHAHSQGIQYVAANGISIGAGGGMTFKPNDPVTRGQMATFLYRASGNDPDTAPSVNADMVDGKHADELGASAGPAGAKGDKGDTGATGATGPAGPQGPAGVNGISLVWLGTYSSPPASPAVNNAYYNSSDRTSYLWDGNSWEILSQPGAAGPVGPAGPPGSIGLQGEKGEAGETGPAGPVGPPGPQGEKGEQGPAGPSAFGIPQEIALSLEYSGAGDLYYASEVMSSSQRGLIIGYPVSLPARMGYFGVIANSSASLLDPYDPGTYGYPYLCQGTTGYGYGYFVQPINKDVHWRVITHGHMDYSQSKFYFVPLGPTTPPDGGGGTTPTTTF